MTAPRLTRSDYALPADALAPRLLGCRLVRILDTGERLAGVIVETEAYLGERDHASHARDGRRTARNESMYAAPGTFYVYFTYGMHHCCNVSCLEEGAPEAVLIRALAPDEGLNTMRALRSAKPRRTPLRDAHLCAGPGRLCQAMDIDRALDAADLTASPAVFIERAVPVPRARVGRSPRIGVASAGRWADKPLRWFIKGDPHVSAPRVRAAP